MRNPAAGAPGRGLLDLARSALRRYWDADGPSHTRALAYHSMLVLLSGLIGFIGLAAALDLGFVRRTVEEWLVRLSPGPSGRVLREALRQGVSGGAAAVLGLGTAIVVGTRAMAQFQRAADRILGISEDRPLLRRYLVGFALACSAGLLLAAGALVFAGGESLAAGARFRSESESIWTILRWPVAVIFVALAIAVLYRVAPRARPPTRPLLGGASAAIVLWMGFTALLVLYFSLSHRSTQTYGPLVGVVALLIWSALTSLALHLGLAWSAELSQAPTPRRAVGAPAAAVS